MIPLLRSDIVRLRTLRSTYVTLIALFLLVGAVTAGSLAAAGQPGFTTPSQLREPVTASAGILSAVALALFAAMRVAGEYRYDTIGQRLLASPRRGQLLAVTFLTHGVLGLAVGSLGLGLGLVTARTVLATPERSLEMTPQIAATVVLANLSFSLIGVCCGVLCRSQPAAVLVIVGTFVAEKLLGLLIGGAAAYLPYGLLTPLLQLEGATTGSGSAVVALVSITVGLMVAACVMFSRRDITA